MKPFLTGIGLMLIALMMALTSCAPAELAGYSFEMVTWVASDHHAYTVTKLPVFDRDWLNSFRDWYSAMEYLDIYVSKDKAAGVSMEDELTRIAKAFPEGTAPSVVRSFQREVYHVYTTDMSIWEAEYMYGQGL